MEEEQNLVAGWEEKEEKMDFEPTEDELVLHFLRPQLRGFAPRVPGAVVEADPCAAAPWELLARHGLLQRGHGYFFTARRRGNALVRRTPAGGVSVGSWIQSGNRENGQSMTALGVMARWSKTRYVFYRLSGVVGKRSMGWVMSEYEITDPLCYRRADDGEEDEYWVLCHVLDELQAAEQAVGIWRPTGELEDLDSGTHGLPCWIPSVQI